MRAHWSYFKYVFWHKWYVFLECCKLGIPLLGIVHDLSKFLPSEWFPYVHSFYNRDGTRREIRNKSGYYDPSSISTVFDYAWLHHQKWNKHHWQYWILVKDEDGDRLMRMPDKYMREMLADWRGAGRAMGKTTAAEWYVDNEHKIQLHTENTAWIERQLGI